jgi:hypothetical protein
VSLPEVSPEPSPGPSPEPGRRTLPEPAPGSTPSTHDGPPPAALAWLLSAARYELAHATRDAATTLAAAVEQAAAPPRVAIAGRVSAGKSTLVNALIGRKLAATAAGETTRVPAWYRHGAFASAGITVDDGTTLPIAVPLDGPLDTLPLPAGRITRIDVTDTTVPRDLVLVDTPGLASATSDASAAAARLVGDGGTPAADLVDVLLFVVNGPFKQDEVDVVRRFREATARAGGRPRVVVALSKADRLSSDPSQAMTEARALAARIAASHADLVDTVVPVVGLLAETGRLTLSVRDCEVLHALAAAWDEATLAVAVQDRQLFRELPVPSKVTPEVTAEDRDRLLDAVGLYGAAELVRHARRRPAAARHEISDHALALSGLADLEAAVGVAVEAGGTQLMRAARLADAVRAAAFQRGAAPGMRDRVETLAFAPQMLAVRVTHLRGALVAAGTRLPAAFERQVTRVCTARGLVAASPDEAATEIRRWRSWALTCTEPGRRLADEMVRAWESAGAA